MLVARKVRQRGGDADAIGTITHARDCDDIRFLPATEFHVWPQCMCSRHSIAVGHPVLNLDHVPVREREILGNDVAQIEHKGSHGIHLIGGQGLGLVPGHGTVDVVPQGRQGGDFHECGSPGIGPVQQTRHPAGLDVIGGGSTNDWTEYLVGLAKHAMAGSTFAFPHFLTLCDRARTGWQALEIGAHIDIPRRLFAGRRDTPDAGKLLGCKRRTSGRCAQQGKHQREPASPGSLRKPGHS